MCAQASDCSSIRTFAKKKYIPTSLHWSVFVPIDPSSAVVSTKVPITQGPTPTPSPIISPVANTICSVLKNLAENADYFKCTSDTTPPCDTVYCTEELGNKIP